MSTLSDQYKKAEEAKVKAKKTSNKSTKTTK